MTAEPPWAAAATRAVCRTAINLLLPLALVFWIVLGIFTVAGVYNLNSGLQGAVIPQLIEVDLGVPRNVYEAAHPAMQQVHKSPPRGPRVAICLVGGARAFELTGPTIKKYVLDVYHDADIFLHSPLDQDAHKFTILSGTKNLAAARIFKPESIPPSRAPQGLLMAANSPNGTQGLMQYFSLVEGCMDMIKGYQDAHNLTYDWIVRTRVDTFWNNPLPPLSSFNNQSYTVPYGSQYGGLNDRLGIGTWRTSEAALARVSFLPALHSHGYSGLNSETAFKMQLSVSNISYETRLFPFCVLSRRTYGWPSTPMGVPVASILSRGPLNGAKCRPCTPAATGITARRVADTLHKKWGWIGPFNSTEDLQLCEAKGEWESNWESVYSEALGPSDRVDERKMLYSRTAASCVKDVEALMAEWGSWTAPSPQEICKAARQS